MTPLAALRVGSTLWSLRERLGMAAAAAALGPLFVIVVAVSTFLSVGTPDGGLSMPVVAGRLTQPFGCTSLELEPWSESCPGHHWHNGVDLLANAGTPVVSAGPGTALVAEDPDGYGTYVMVTHPGRIRTLYAHLEAATVRSGDRVVSGQTIGRLGSTGRSTGPHLHFEVRIDGTPVDPLGFVPGILTEVMPAQDAVRPEP